MEKDTWVVKRAEGEELGIIRKLIIDSTTRQLSYADVALTQTNQLIRLPWTELEIRHDGIFLKSTHLPLVDALRYPSHATTLETLEVPRTMAGKIGQSRRTHW